MARLTTYLDEHAGDDPTARLLGVFDFLASWFDDGFFGCMFINAVGEFSAASSDVRRLAVEHKSEIVEFLRETCIAARLDEPDALAAELAILVEGAVVTAQIAGCGAAGAVEAARRAKGAAQKLIAHAG